MITNKMLSKEIIRELLKISLSEKHLFYKIGEVLGDGVFNRTFTILIIRCIILYHLQNGEDLLSGKEILSLNESIIKYMRLEKDLRGYDKDKGYGHAMGHSGDALRTIAYSKDINHNELVKIIEVIKEKICISNYVYINEEAERLVNVIMAILSRNILKDEEIRKWIKSFVHTNTPNDYPEMHYFKENVKNFLRSLYFRIKFKGSNSSLLVEIEEVLNQVNQSFNKII